MGSSDLVAKVPLKVSVQSVHPTNPEPTHALLHFEVEWRNHVEPLRRRIYNYNVFFINDSQIPVLSVGFYVNVGLEGQGMDSYVRTFDGEEQLEFRYPYVGLPALNAEDYVEGDNWLGVALSAKMRCPRGARVNLAYRALERLVECDKEDYDKFLLGEFVCAYGLPTEQERQEFLQRLNQETNQRIKAMTQKLVNPWVEDGKKIGREEGMQQGRQEGQEKVLREKIELMWEKKFAPLEAETLQQLRNVPASQLDDLFLKILEASTAEEVNLPTTRAE